MTTPILLPLQISITSDTICPFCFIGLRKLERALKSSDSIRLASFSHLSGPPTGKGEGGGVKLVPRVRFLPFQLDPTLPKDHAVSKRETYKKKFGEGRVEMMERMMIERGREVGIEFSYGGPIRSTLKSHRLIEKSFQKGGSEAQLKVINSLFRAYFEKEADPGSDDLLSRVAEEEGIFETHEQAIAFLESRECLQEVEKGFMISRLKGISGVPHFELEVLKPIKDDSPSNANNHGWFQAVKDPDHEDRLLARAEVGGAQETETFLDVFEKLLQRAVQNLGGQQGLSKLQQQQPQESGQDSLAEQAPSCDLQGKGLC
ncbi:hypothetical protein IE53DRAFT_387860 [Violaceomyces palustris]|uniref:Uncharacterized protein n=1 Tax=Violaceomyces palustris TaxID=1673888 RepID=A0ACD0NVR9_9BASI|nr:hypothetical protein IE53DRAFT_387860 [Violaceomyces palustris]